MSIIEKIKPALRPFKRYCIERKKRRMGIWAYFLETQEKAIKTYLLPFYWKQSQHSIQDAGGKVVFMCNGADCISGGLADRLKGLAAIYWQCKKHKYDFRIHFVSPFRLEEYLQPNDYIWLIDDNCICYGVKQVTIRRCFLDNTLFHEDFQRNKFQLVQAWLDKNIVADSKEQLHVYTNINTLTQEEFATAFRELFRPSPRLQAEIDRHAPVLGDSYISISFRFTTLLGDFEDCTGSPLPVEERQQLIDECLAAIARIRLKAPAHDRVLVTADSPTFVEQVKHMTDVYVIPGEIGHIDYKHSDAVNMKTFLDFWLISQAKAAYLFRTGKMYNSAFAKTAAMAGGKPFEVVE